MDSMVSSPSLTLRRTVFVYEKQKQTDNKEKVQMTYLNEDRYLKIRITHKFHIQNK